MKITTIFFLISIYVTDVLSILKMIIEKKGVYELVFELQSIVWPLQGFCNIPVLR